MLAQSLEKNCICADTINNVKWTRECGWNERDVKAFEMEKAKSSVGVAKDIMKHSSMKSLQSRSRYFYLSNLCAQQSLVSQKPINFSQELSLMKLYRFEGNRWDVDRHWCQPTYAYKHHRLNFTDTAATRSYISCHEHPFAFMRKSKKESN